MKLLNKRETVVLVKLTEGILSLTFMCVIGILEIYFCSSCNTFNVTQSMSLTDFKSVFVIFSVCWLCPTMCVVLSLYE